MASPEPPTVRARAALLFAFVWVPYALLVRRFRFVTDDVYISFRYARNLARGLGLRYNPGEAPPTGPDAACPP